MQLYSGELTARPIRPKSPTGSAAMVVGVLVVAGWVVIRLMEEMLQRPGVQQRGQLKAVKAGDGQEEQRERWGSQ